MIDLSGNDVSGNKLYTDTDGKLYNKCNATVNSNEYYIDSDVAISVAGGVVSMPFLISSIICSSIITCLLTMLAYSFYNKSEKKITVKLVFTVLCCFIFLSSTIRSILYINKAKNQMTELTNNPNARPCYSENKKQIIR